MDITIRYIHGCVNVGEAERRVREALRLIGRAAVISRELVAAQSDADRLSFAGSPTILISGHDPFAGPRAPSAIACRIYTTDAGPDVAPSVSQLIEALRRLGASQTRPTN